jgi:hypothetical protein
LRLILRIKRAKVRSGALRSSGKYPQVDYEETKNQRPHVMLLLRKSQE